MGNAKVIILCWVVGCNVLCWVVGCNVGCNVLCWVVGCNVMISVQLLFLYLTTNNSRKRH